MSIHSKSEKTTLERLFLTILSFLVLLRPTRRFVLALQLTGLRIILPFVILASNLPVLDGVGEPAQKTHAVPRGMPDAQSRQTR